MHDSESSPANPQLGGLMAGVGVFHDEWGLGPIRQDGELYPYVSGSPDLPGRDKITHEIESMLVWHRHNDRVIWAVKTTRGRIIVVMQQQHDADRTRVGGQIELTNAPFKDTAIKILGEDILDLRALRDIIGATGA